MPKKKRLINLTEEEHKTLIDMTCKGKVVARKFKRATILLKTNEGLSDLQIMDAVQVSRPTLECMRKR
jgi:hypothetical protein